MTEPKLPDVQDPLPESGWFWRRLYVFAVTAAILWMVWGAIDRLGASAMLQPAKGVPALLSLCKSLLFLVLAMATYYLVAPSAEQITKMVKTASLLKNGVQFAARSSSEDESGSKAEAATTVGLPPAPPIPGPPVAADDDEEDYAPRSRT